MTNQTPIIPSDLFTGKILGLVDREREVKQFMYALYTKEHMILMGPPGTAKSQFAVNAFSAIAKAETFQIHLTKQTTEEYVFGPLNILELKKGNLVHNTKGSMLTADFAFLDEFFDASDVLLRSLLGILNERVWLKGSQRIKAKLHTAVLTSNYQRENKVTEAVLDRIIFKCDIKAITARGKRLKVYRNAIKHPVFNSKQVLDLDKLKKFTDLVEDPNSVKFSKELLGTYDRFLGEFQKESKKYISQRTANKALKVLKVSALLDNRDEASYKDLEELRYVLCVLNRRMEEAIFDAVYEKHIGKAEEERVTLQDLKNVEEKVKKMPDNFDGLPDKEFIGKMRELNEYVHLLEGIDSPTQRTSQKRDTILTEIRKLIADNRDKLFKKQQANPTP